MFLSFDIGGTNTKYSLINEYGEILENGSFLTKDNKEIIFKNIKEITEKFQAVDKNIEGLAFSMPW